jgi:hypothetical protein
MEFYTRVNAKGKTVEEDTLWKVEYVNMYNI